MSVMDREIFKRMGIYLWFDIPAPWWGRGLEASYQMTSTSWALRRVLHALLSNDCLVNLIQA